MYLFVLTGFVMILEVQDLCCQIEEICRFCRPPEKERILFQTEHFYLMVSLGPIVEGYLLIISKEHIGACLHLSEDYMEEFLVLKERVNRILTEVYGGCIFFEHGKTGSCLQSGKDHIHCYHAHLHCIPANVDLNSIISNELTATQYKTVLDCYQSMSEVEKYLYVEDTRICTYQTETKLRSQYLRYKLAEALGCPERWDWVNYQNWPLIYESIKVLKPFFI